MQGIPFNKPVKADNCPYGFDNERSQIPGIGQGKHDQDRAHQVEAGIEEAAGRHLVGLKQ